MSLKIFMKFGRTSNGPPLDHKYAFDPDRLACQLKAILMTYHMELSCALALPLGMQLLR